LKSLAVLQVIDSLAMGGMEAVAVNLANGLAERQMRSFLCFTRAGGPLEERLAPAVTRLDLGRKALLDPAALRRLARFINRHQIDIVHAHGSSLFFSALAGLFASRAHFLWHDHFGRYATEERPAWIYRMATRRCAGIIAVNQPLAEWARRRLKAPAARVWYVPNFVAQPPGAMAPPTDLPGTPGGRIVCVANLRPEKDHATLIEAMKRVSQAAPAATLLLAGEGSNQAQASRLQQQIRRHDLASHVFLLGSRPDIRAILGLCDIGVLSSVSEGMPLALLEYGSAGLPAVATAVGQVPEVLDDGRAGLLIPPRQPAALAEALLKLLRSPELRSSLGTAFQRRVQQRYGEQAVLGQIIEIYKTLTWRRNGPSSHPLDP
jgi:glycosyltransferase involved in cell wall biosynthesis